MTEDFSRDIVEREAHQRRLAWVIAITLVVALVVAIAALIQWALAVTP